MGRCAPLLITLEYPPQVGGVANYYHSLLHHWSVPCAVEVVSPTSWLKLIPWLYRQVKKYHSSHILVGQVLPLGTVALVIHWLTGLPYVVFTHGMDVLVPQRYPRKRWLLRSILRSADHIIANSQFTKHTIQTFDPTIKKISIIHPTAYITPQITPQVVSGLPQQYILSVGRLVERKGFDMVIRALEHFPDLRYVMAGSGDDKSRLMELVDQVRVNNRVYFFNDLTDAEIAYLYQQCLFLVMPSRKLPNGDVEGFGIVVLEANSFGKTAIGGIAGGMADAMQHEQTGLLVDGTNLSALVAAIEKLLDDDYRHTLEISAQRYAEGQTWEYAAKQLSAIVNSND